MLLLTFPLSHVLVERHDDSLGLSATSRAHAQLGQLVTHWAVERGEVLRNSSLPAHFLSSHRRGAGHLLDLDTEMRDFNPSRKNIIGLTLAEVFFWPVGSQTCFCHM